MNLYRTRGSRFTGVESLNPVVAAQFQELESVEGQADSIIPRRFTRRPARRSFVKLEIMCRSIKVLRRPEEPATREEISAAALQFVRKVSGYRKPSKANEASFDHAVVEIAKSVETLLDQIGYSPKQ